MTRGALISVAGTVVGLAVVFLLAAVSPWVAGSFAVFSLAALAISARRGKLRM